MIITIDGPSGTGKSSVTKQLARRLGFIHVDTGAMYRTVAYGVLKHQIQLDEAEKLQQLLDNFDFQVQLSEEKQRFFFEAEDVTEKIRSEKVTALVSAVSALAAVREKLVRLQRQLAGKNNLIFEGRDMGTVVFPEAELKIFLTARPEVRAERRLRQFQEKGDRSVTLEMVLGSINRRDTFDASRELSPLRPADDAVIVDTSDLSLDGVVDRLIALYQRIQMG